MSDIAEETLAEDGADTSFDRRRLSKKRKRTSRACDQCRGRKQKCDGQQPTCSPCSVAELSCKYGHISRKRGLPMGYVRSLELLWALVFSVVPKSDELVANLLREIEFDLDDGGKLAISSNTTKTPNNLRQVWTDSGLQAKLERRLSRLEADEVDQDTSSPDGRKSLSSTAKSPFVSETLSLEPFQINLGSMGRLGLGLPRWLAGAQRDEARGFHNGHDHSTLNSAECSVAEQSSRNNETAMSLPKNSRHLLDIYFSYTHCWLPVIKKHVMLEILYSYPMTKAKSPGTLATFWAMLAYASMQESVDHIDMMVVDESDINGARASPQAIYAQARSLIPNEESVAEVGHANALLILSLCKIHGGTWTSAWYLIGQAVRTLLVSRGPGVPADNIERTSSAETEQNMNLSLLSCFVMDTLLACQLGLPPHLRTIDIQNVSLTEETGMDEWEPWTAAHVHNASHSSNSQGPARIFSIFNRKIELMRILNDLLQGQISDPHDQDGTGHRSSLRRWEDHLPQYCFLPDQEPQGTTRDIPPQLFNLHLAFQITTLLLKVKYRSAIDPWLSPENSHTEATQNAIHRLLLHSASLFGPPYVPAVFAIYKTIDDREANKIKPSDSFTGLQLAMPSNSMLQPIAQQPPFVSERNPSSAVNARPTTISQAMNDPTPISQIVTESLATIPLGYTNDLTDGDTMPDRPFPVNPDVLQDIWAPQHSEFLQNLGFTTAIPYPSGFMDPP